MNHDSSILHALMPLLVLGTAAALWLLLAWAGRMVNAHRHCGKCGFDLFGLTQPVRCPECGQDLRKESAQRLGQWRWRRVHLAVGLAVLLLGAGISGVSLFRIFTDLGANHFKPTWWLIHLETQRRPAAVTAALDELFSRDLSEAQRAALIERALVVQANRNKPWLGQWAAILEQAAQDDELSPDQLQRYFRAAGDLTVIVRTRMRQGQRIPIRLILAGDRISDGWSTTNPWKMQFTCLSFVLDGRELAGGEPLTWIAQQPSGTQLDIVTPWIVAVGAAQQGQILQYHSVWKIEYGNNPDLWVGSLISPFPLAFKPLQPVLASWQVQSNGQFTIVGHDQQTVRPVGSAQLDQLLRSSLEVWYSEDPFSRLPIMRVTLTRPLPVGLALDVLLETEDQKFVLPSLYVPKGDTRAIALATKPEPGFDSRLSPPIARIVLRPSLEAAEKFVDAEQCYVGPELVITGEPAYDPRDGTWKYTLSRKPQADEQVLPQDSANQPVQ